MGRRGRRKLIIPFLAPAIILYGIFFVYPTIQGLWVSLHDWSGWTLDMEFIGLRNFVELAGDKLFRAAFKNTLFLGGIGGVLIFATAFFFTAIMTRGLRGKNFFRAMMFFPQVVSPVAVGILFSFIFNRNWGLINMAFRTLKLSFLQRTWLGPQYALWSLLLTIVWHAVGYYVVIFLAGFDKIPDTYFEAARLDGANEWQIFWKITIPLLWDVIVVALVLYLIASLQIFSIVYSMFGGVPPIRVWTLAVYIYILAFGGTGATFRLGYGTAAAVVVLIAVIIGTVITQRLTQREAVEY